MERARSGRAAAPLAVLRLTLIGLQTLLDHAVKKLDVGQIVSTYEHEQQPDDVEVKLRVRHGCTK